MWRFLWWLPFGSVPEIEPEVLRKRMADGERFFLIDVRTETEFAHGHIRGAQSIPIHELQRSLDDLQIGSDQTTVAICKTAHRSIPAVRLLRRRGIQAFQLAGGMDRWRRTS